MKKNKGFTLIELLAVIVILAIIALIATPIILGVIEDARKSSAQSSALGYIDAVEKQIAIDMLKTDAGEETTDRIVYTPGTAITVADIGDKVKVKGTKPDDASTIKINDDGIISDGTCLKIKIGGNDYNVKYDGSKAEIVETCDTTATP